jgi:alpha-beta hydrolase superfamily lysophospholipase
LKNLIRTCLGQGFAVTVYDLPGHGLSTGERFSINDFSEYVDVLNDFIKLCQHELPEPFHLIGHSTGSAIAYEYMNAAQNMIFDKVIFLAPLVHNAHWNISKPFIFLQNYLPGIFHGSTE